MFVKALQLLGKFLFTFNAASLWILVREGKKAAIDYLRYVWAVYLWRRSVLSTLRSRKLPEIDASEAFPGLDSVQVSLTHLPFRPGSLSVEELTILVSIAQYLRPKRIVEIGTAEGRTTLNLALNSPDDADVITIDLPRELVGIHRKHSGPDYSQMNISEPGSLFLNHPLRSKIKLVLADSTRFDWSPYERSVDLVLIDGAHDYESVRKDSENALKMIRPGGIIVWHDYGVWEGVTRCVDELSESLPIFVLKGTSLACLRVTESELQNLDKKRAI